MDPQAATLKFCLAKLCVRLVHVMELLLNNILYLHALDITPDTLHFSNLSVVHKFCEVLIHLLFMLAYHPFCPFTGRLYELSYIFSLWDPACSQRNASPRSCRCTWGCKKGKCDTEACTWDIAPVFRINRGCCRWLVSNKVFCMCVLHLRHLSPPLCVFSLPSDSCRRWSFLPVVVFELDCNYNSLCQRYAYKICRRFDR